MDWVRLCNSGKDMTGTGGAMLNVSMEQLASHNKPSDAWLAIRGTLRKSLVACKFISYYHIDADSFICLQVLCIM